MRKFIKKILRPLTPTTKAILGAKKFRRLKSRIFPERLEDEVQAVFAALGAHFGSEGIMIDVGAHFGESFEPFMEEGWTVHCFEPNLANHPKITATAAENIQRVHIFPFAVSDRSRKGVKLYLSDESSGISSLHAFHNSHREGFEVDTISLADHVRNTGLTRVDFLKIDAEGHDFFALQGINWNELVPEVIICEFEDRKTKDLGYTFKDMAQYLVDRGYSVIVSEWHPIIAYGRRHSWNRYTSYPSDLQHADAWGNLIAMRQGEVGDRVQKILRQIGPIQ